MILKPKTTVQNPKALLYRRFTQLQDSYTANVIYATQDGKYWVFNGNKIEFVEVEISDTKTSSIVNITTNTTIVDFNGSKFYYNNGWHTATATATLEAKFGNIARYQTNKYYFVGSFDYMIRGSIEGTLTQHIKGNIMPLTSLNIKHFNDEVDLAVDDLVVIENHLFSVENPETVQKRMPKAFKVHFATLNSII